MIRKLYCFPGKIFTSVFTATFIFMLISGKIFSNQNSLAVFASIVLFLVANICFYKKSKAKDNDKAKYWLLFGVILGSVFAFFSWIIVIGIEKFFITISGYLEIISFSIFIAILSYFISITVSRFNRRILLFITMLFFLTGFSTAIAYTKDHYWWKSSICSLGMPFNGTPFYYNFTLVMTGLLLSLFFIYLRTDLVRLVDKNQLTKRQLKLSAINYFTVILFIILVGALPYGYGAVANDIHVRAAQLAYVFFGVFIFFIHQLMPIFSKKFEVFSYFTLGIGLFLYLLFNPFGLYSMATFEIITIIMMGFWFFIFIRNIDLVKKIVTSFKFFAIII